jgi:hypothetical protein
VAAATACDVYCSYDARNKGDTSCSSLLSAQRTFESAQQQMRTGRKEQEGGKGVQPVEGRSHESKCMLLHRPSPLPLTGYSICLNVVSFLRCRSVQMHASVTPTLRQSHPPPHPPVSCSSSRRTNELS